MALNIPSNPVDPRAVDRTSAGTAPASAASARVADSVRVSPAATAAQLAGGEPNQLAGAARMLGESLAKVDAEAEVVERAGELVGALSRATAAEAPAVLARLDELGRSPVGQAAGVDRERLGLAGTAGDEAVRNAREALAGSREELQARRAQLEQEGEALAARLVGGRQPPELAPDRVQRAREQISSDTAAAVAAQASQLATAVAELLG